MPHRFRVGLRCRVVVFAVYGFAARPTLPVWPLALLMAAGLIVGSYGGAGVSRGLGQKNVRRLVIAIDLGLTVSLLIRY
ncbi:MAG: hypothetical protein ACLQNE_25880 [Thermoguttaceae bacterium]